MRRLLVCVGFVVVAALAIAGATVAADNPNALTLAVYGDSPYLDARFAPHSELTATPAFIETINADASVQEIRQIFFANLGWTLGRHPMQVVSQANAFDPAHPADAQYVENVIWEQSKTVFVTLNLPGGSNNDIDPWNGDSHVFRSDDPLQEGSTCYTEGGSCTADAWLQHPYYDVPNFHRIVVHGSTFPLEWMKLSIDPRAAWENVSTPSSWGPFSWERETQAQLTP